MLTFTWEIFFFTDFRILEILEEYGCALDSVWRERRHADTDSLDNMFELVILLYYKMVVKNHSFSITKPQSIYIILYFSEGD